MLWEEIQNLLNLVQENFIAIITSWATYNQLGLIVICYLLAYLIAKKVCHRFHIFREPPEPEFARSRQLFMYRLGHMLFPLFAIVLLRVSVGLLAETTGQPWLVMLAINVALILLYISFVHDFIPNDTVSRLMLWIGIPILLLNAIGILDNISNALNEMAIQVGNIRISMLGVLRVLIFGSFIFWLGRVSNNTGQELIRNQERLDYRTREVAAKLFEIGIFVIVFILLLQVMGINLTALAVFGGAVGVGLGFGLQSIASNFMSGVIILLDRSLSIGDYIELEDGRTGHVTSMNMRSTTLETFDGKDIIVPNEMFISSTFINWTHKNKKQRYRVDFSVAYDSDIRKLVEIIKEAVATHPQVLSGEQYPIEERPDCEIDSFGDSGVNMFVEFWMEAIDDGKNRVGGDLLLIIFEAIRENGFTIPFPQREVRMLQS
jgi:small-conductance mechanosensitive channel